MRQFSEIGRNDVSNNRLNALLQYADRSAIPLEIALNTQSAASATKGWFKQGHSGAIHFFFKIMRMDDPVASAARGFPHRSIGPCQHVGLDHTF